MAKQKIYRQGDVLFVEISSIPKRGVVQLSHRIIAEGEATGHKHQFLEDTAVLLEDAATDPDTLDLNRDYRPRYFLNVHKSTQIVHEEHHTVNLPVGFYSIVIQREYIPLSLRPGKRSRSINGGFSYVAD